METIKPEEWKLETTSRADGNWASEMRGLQLGRAFGTDDDFESEGVVEKRKFIKFFGRDFLI